MEKKGFLGNCVLYKRRMYVKKRNVLHLIKYNIREIRDHLSYFKSSFFTFKIVI